MPSPIFDGLGETIHGIFKDASPAIFTPNGSESQSIEIIFNDRYQETDLSGFNVGAPKPVAWFKTGEIAPEYNDILTVNDVDYIIREIKPDGLELTQLTLSTAPVT